MSSVTTGQAKTAIRQNFVRQLVDFWSGNGTTDDQLRATVANPPASKDFTAEEVRAAVSQLLTQRATLAKAVTAAAPAPQLEAPVDAPMQARQHKEVAFTFATDTKECGRKRYVVHPDGSVSKEAAGTSFGHLMMVTGTLDSTANLTDPCSYVVLGVPKGREFGQAVEYGIGKDASFARSGAHIEYREGIAGVLVCDLDPKGHDDCFPPIEGKGPAEYHAKLVAAVPALAGIDAVAHPSGSCGDVVEIATGRVLKRSEGTHCRFPIKDMSDMERALKVLHERSMLAGHMHALVDSAGFIHIRSNIDASLSAIARPVFSCEAAVPPGYELRNRPQPFHVYGDYLDTKAALLDLTDEERKLLDMRIEAMKSLAQVKALSERRRTEYLAAHPEWARAVNSATRSPKGGYPVMQLYGDELIDVAGQGILKASELAERWDELTNGGKRKLNCRDPLEPHYGSDSIAIVFEGRIFSQAHHGRTFTLPRTEPPHSVEDFKAQTDASLWSKLEAVKGTKCGPDAYYIAAKALTYRHAAIRDGANVLLLDRRHLSAVDTSEGFLSKAAFFDIYNTYTVELPSFGPDGEETSTTVNLPQWWYGSEHRHVYDNLVLAPAGKRPGGKPVASSSFNLWRGLSCQPCEQGSCETFKHYLLHVICGGDQRGAAWVWRWLAHLVQRPWEKPGVAIALTGPQGVGKTTLGEVAGSLFHRKHFFQTADMSRLTGRFTSSTALAILMLLDEAFWSGDKRVIGQVKDSITSSHATYEAKGKDAFQIDSYTRYIFTSNRGARHPRRTVRPPPHRVQRGQPLQFQDRARCLLRPPPCRAGRGWPGSPPLGADAGRHRGWSLLSVRQRRSCRPKGPRVGAGGSLPARPPARRDGVLERRRVRPPRRHPGPARGVPEGCARRRPVRQRGRVRPAAPQVTRRGRDTVRSGSRGATHPWLYLPADCRCTYLVLGEDRAGYRLDDGSGNRRVGTLAACKGRRIARKRAHHAIQCKPSRLRVLKACTGNIMFYWGVHVFTPFTPTFDEVAKIPGKSMQAGSIFKSFQLQKVDVKDVKDVSTPVKHRAKRCTTSSRLRRFAAKACVTPS